MVHHPLTDKGIVQFKEDWEAAAREAARRQGLTARRRDRRVAPPIDAATAIGAR